MKPEAEFCIDDGSDVSTFQKTPPASDQIRSLKLMKKYQAVETIFTFFEEVISI